MSMMRVKNTSGFDVSIILPNVRYRRDLRPGQETNLPDDVAEEFNFDPGCRAYIKSGFLKIVNATQETKDVFGEMPKDTEVDVVDLLTNKTVNDLAVALKNGSASLKDKVVTEAIRLCITDATRCSLIKHHCDIDILQAIALQRSINN